MEQYKIEANESFFNNILFLLREGGTWIWPDNDRIFIKKGDKLIGSPEALEEISRIVSKKFFRKHFRIRS